MSTERYAEVYWDVDSHAGPCWGVRVYEDGSEIFCDELRHIDDDAAEVDIAAMVAVDYEAPTVRLYASQNRVLHYQAQPESWRWAV